jgi:hypothetical protein
VQRYLLPDMIFQLVDINGVALGHFSDSSLALGFSAAIHGMRQAISGACTTHPRGPFRPQNIYDAQVLAKGLLGRRSRSRVTAFCEGPPVLVMLNEVKHLAN